MTKVFSKIAKTGACLSLALGLALSVSLVSASFGNVQQAEAKDLAKACTSTFDKVDKQKAIHFSLDAGHYTQANVKKQFHYLYFQTVIGSPENIQVCNYSEGGVQTPEKLKVVGSQIRAFLPKDAVNDNIVAFYSKDGKLLGKVSYHVTPSKKAAAKDTSKASDSKKSDKQDSKKKATSKKSKFTNKSSIATYKDVLDAKGIYDTYTDGVFSSAYIKAGTHYAYITTNYKGVTAVNYAKSGEVTDVNVKSIGNLDKGFTPKTAKGKNVLAFYTKSGELLWSYAYTVK